MKVSRMKAKRGSRVLVIACGAAVQLRVVRCAARAGLRVLILGDRNGLPLRWSTSCEEFILTSKPIADVDITDEALSGLADEINTIAKTRDLRMVIPSDGRTTRILIRMKELLKVPVFPVPSLQAFDTLNDKWQFFNLCQRIGVTTPRTRLFEATNDLMASLRDGSLWLPGIAKPTNMYGEIGVKRVSGANAEETLRSILYEPVLFQEFIDGEDVSISLLCKDGAYSHSVHYKQSKKQFSYFHNVDLLQLAARVVEETRFTGVINFDARIDHNSGKIYVFECNPRFWYTMDFAMIAGLNFIEAQLRPESAPTSVAGIKVRRLESLTRASLRPWRIQRKDVAALFYEISDPIPSLIWVYRKLTRKPD